MAFRRQWRDLFLVLNNFDFDGVQRGIWLVADVQINVKKHLLAIELLHGVLRAKMWCGACIVGYLKKRSFDLSLRSADGSIFEFRNPMCVPGQEFRCQTPLARTQKIGIPD